LSARRPPAAADAPRRDQPLRVRALPERERQATACHLVWSHSVKPVKGRGLLPALSTLRIEDQKRKLSPATLWNASAPLP
jgi:hypothetical protein